MFAVLLVIPLGIPDFVVSFGWRGLFPSFSGFWAAVLVMTLAVYPLVFLPVAASLRAADPAQEEVARSLGLGRVAHLLDGDGGPGPPRHPGRVAPGRTGVLAEFGAFEILGYQTLTTEIYNEFQVGFNEPAACALSLILVLLGALLLAGEGSVRGQGRASRLGAGAARAIRPVPLGRARPAAFAGAALLVGLALGVPGGLHRLPDRPGGYDHLAAGLAGHRHRQHLRLRRRGRARGHRGRAARSRCCRCAFPAAG